MSYFTDHHEDLFRKTLGYSLGLYLLAAVVVTIIQLPAIQQPDVKNLSTRVAKLILEPPAAPPKPTPVHKVPKGSEGEKKKKPTKKPAKIKKNPQPTIQLNREMVKKSGLLASFIEEETHGGLTSLIENEQLNKALSNVDLIVASSRKNSRPMVRMALPNKSDLADKTIATLGTLQKKDRVKLAKKKEIVVSPLKSVSAGTGMDVRDHGLGSGVGLRLRGSGSGSALAAIDYDAIARVVEKYKGGLIYLYNKELRSNPTLKGTITVEFSIDERGKVVDVRLVTSTMDYSPLEKALARRIKMWKFPKLFDGVIMVTYPFVFFPV